MLACVLVHCSIEVVFAGSVKTATWGLKGQMGLQVQMGLKGELGFQGSDAVEESNVLEKRSDMVSISLHPFLLSVHSVPSNACPPLRPLSVGDSPSCDLHKYGQALTSA